MKLFEVIEHLRDVSLSHRYIKSFHTGKEAEVNKQNIAYPCAIMSFPYTQSQSIGYLTNETVRYIINLDILTTEYYGFDITGTTSADTFNTNYMISSDVDESVEFKDENKLRETTQSIAQHIVAKILNDEFQTPNYDFNIVSYQVRSLERKYNDFVTGVRLRLEVDTNNPYYCEYEDYFTPSTPVVLCKSLSFDGVNEYIDCSNNSAFDFETTDAFSVETWVKYDSLSGIDFLVSKWLTVLPSDAKAFFIGTNGDKLTFRIFVGNATGIIMDTTVSLVVGQWYHLVTTYDGSTNASGVNFYINDVTSGVSIIRDNLSGSMTNTEPLHIGGQNVYYSDAIIAKTRIWNTELTAGDVTTMYNGGVIQETPVKTANLVLDLDIPTATWNGTEYEITDLSSTNATCITSNMDIIDLIDDCPSA